jgi:hypothetical protein
VYFTKHTGTIALGVLITMILALGLAITAKGHDTSGATFFTMWVVFVGLLLGLIVEVSFVPACRTAVSVRGGWLKLVPGLAALTAFGAALVFMLRELAEGVSPAFSMSIVALIAFNLIWGPLLKRRTARGRDAMDQIAGFRLFLEKVEKDRLEKLNPVDEQLQLMDAHLPYAIALEVREAWGDHLAQTFFAATVMR